MMGHNICFYGEIWLIIPQLSLLPFLSGALVITGSAEYTLLPGRMDKYLACLIQQCTYKLFKISGCDLFRIVWFGPSW